MGDRFEVARLYVQAQMQDQGAAAALAGYLTDDIIHTSSRGTVRGPAAVMAHVGAPPSVVSNFRASTWAEPVADGDCVKLAGRMPLLALSGGYDLTFEFDAAGNLAHIDRVELPPPPLPPSEMRLTDEIKERVKNAWHNAPILVICVDATGTAMPSLRNAIVAVSDDQLGFWARNVHGATATALETNPKLTIFYREAALRASYVFFGRGWVAQDEKLRRFVFDNSPDHERAADPDMSGIAIICELDRVDGYSAGQRVLMERGAPPR